MPDSLTAIVTAVFLWWLTTGLILLVVRGYAARRLILDVIAGFLLVGGLLLVEATAPNATSEAAYGAFLAILAVWGGIEISFLSGWITGPNKQALPEDLAGAARFWAASRVVLWHEMLIALIGLYLITRFREAPNAVPVLTYSILWGMRISAKLNLYLGVRNTGESFLPPHMKYMGAYFARRSMNLLFPFSITAATLLSAWLFHKGLSAMADAYTATAYTLVAMLAALAVIEHWFFMLPLRIEALWDWGRRQPSAGSAEVTSLFLEAASTCDAKKLNHMLEHAIAGGFGAVDTLSGAVRCQEGWVAFEFGAGLAEMRLAGSAERRDSKIMFTGYLIDIAGLRAAFENCAVRSGA